MSERKETQRIALAVGFGLFLYLVVLTIVVVTYRSPLILYPDDLDLTLPIILAFVFILAVFSLWWGFHNRDSKSDART